MRQRRGRRVFAGVFEAGFLVVDFFAVDGFGVAAGAGVTVAAVLLRPPGVSSPPPYNRR